ncbi:hypothetical protein [Acinetobacter bereziniae]|uniref:hypothetical protein n=1 Tax=Acinetobacter bereziniae TaxID=106648 RepID=UPI00069ECE90|nr:hypothetical protein [Acinetobacter bereziniae]
MKADIKRTFIDTFGRISYLFVIFFFFIFILYLHNDVEGAFKEACSTSLNFLSALTTIGAAYIASSLYTDWRDTERYNIAKEALISLVKLKSHLDVNFKNAKYHLESFNLNAQPENLSGTYIAQRINEARSSQAEKEEYKSKANCLLSDFYEKIDIYENIYNQIILRKEDRDYNFKSFVFFISYMYTKAYEGSPEDINIVNQLSDSTKKIFEEQYFDDLLTKLKNKTLI